MLFRDTCHSTLLLILSAIIIIVPTDSQPWGGFLAGGCLAGGCFLWVMIALMYLAKGFCTRGAFWGDLTTFCTILFISYPVRNELYKLPCYSQCGSYMYWPVCNYNHCSILRRNIHGGNIQMIRKHAGPSLDIDFPKGLLFWCYPVGGNFEIGYCYLDGSDAADFSTKVEDTTYWTCDAGEIRRKLKITELKSDRRTETKKLSKSGSRINNNNLLVFFVVSITSQVIHFKLKFN